VQLNVVLPPGTSLENMPTRSRSVSKTESREIDDLKVRSSHGRADSNEHAEGVNMSELILDSHPDSPRSLEEAGSLKSVRPWTTSRDRERASNTDRPLESRT